MRDASKLPRNNFREVKIKPSIRQDIQMLRGLAILSVIGFHGYQKFFSAGFLGVDMFFVISGFVVTPLVLRIFSPRSSNDSTVFSKYLRFLKNRFLRLAPAMTSVIVFSLLGLLFMSDTDEHPRIYKQIILSVMSLGNLGAYSYSGDYFLANPNPFIHAWSLSVEVQIYLLLPLVLVLLSRILILTEERIKKTYLLLGFFSILLFLSLLLPNLDSSIRELIFYVPFSRFWQFACGGFISFLPARRLNLGVYSTPFNSVVLLFGLFLLFSPLKLDSVLAAILATFIAAIIIYFECLSVVPSMIGKALIWVGDRSYSIYLIHMPLLYLAKYSDVTYLPNTSSRALQSITAIALTLFLGSLNYSFVELRFRSNNLKTNRVHFWKLSLLSVSTPIIISGLLLQSYYVDYFGLNRNLAPPAFAGDSSPDCALPELKRSCVLNSNSASPRILLLGDSHAAQYGYVFNEVAARFKAKAIYGALSGCRVQYENGPEDAYPPSCIQHNLAVLNWVKINQPEVIVVSQYIKSDASLNLLKSALTELRSNSEQLLLIANNPVFPDGRLYMRGRPLLSQLHLGPYNPPEWFSTEMMDNADLGVSASLISWARRNSIQTMDVSDIFCLNGICVRRLNGKWLYKDSDHLSIDGANLTSDVWAAAFRNLLKN